MPMHIVAFAGGVGGAKLAHGLAQALAPAELTIIVNTGDDFTHLGLHISPDVDTVTYTLAGLANPVTGWGRKEETWQALEQVALLGGPTWFNLGDRDLGLHLTRTHWLQQGRTLTDITIQIARALGVEPRLLPMCDEPVRTLLNTDEGELAFQEYFVHRRCEPVVRAIRYYGAARATLSQPVQEALAAATHFIFCPSNPYLSLDPILAVPGMRPAVQAKKAIAISPIVGGAAIKGPAAKLMRELGHPVTPVSVAQHYADLLHALVLDHADAQHAPAIEALGIRAHLTDTVMRTYADRATLAARLLAWLA